MSNFKEKCVEFFGTSDFYEILKVESTATDKEIKKAYHKLSLLVHPDRVEEGGKALATEKFKVLGRIHSVLQDKEKRKTYDDCGDYDDENDSDFNWMDYWRKLFKKIEIKDIQAYEQEYIGSETELRDIRKAYEGTKGNMNKMHELIPFMNCESEERIIQIVQRMVDDEEVEYYKRFFEESERQRNKRWEAFRKEKEEVEQIQMSDLEKEIEARSAQRQKGFLDMIGDLENKYAKPKKRKSIKSGADESPKKRTRRSRK